MQKHSMQSPWWADPGPDECESCWEAYYVEVGYFCADCDRAICPVCVLTVFARQVVLCPECHSQGDR